MANKKEFKPEYKYETLTGKFTDYRGMVRDFTMVAVSIPMKYDDAVVTRPVMVEDEYEIPAKNVLNEENGQIEYVPASTEKFIDEVDEVLAPVTKMLSVGVATRCVRDTHDADLGVRIAYGKALKLLDHSLYVSHPGMINTKMVKALLEQEAEHFKKDPGSYLAGYNEAKARYAKDGKIAEVEMTETEIEDASKTETEAHENAVAFEPDAAAPVHDSVIHVTKSPTNFRQKFLDEVKSE